MNRSARVSTLKLWLSVRAVYSRPAYFMGMTRIAPGAGGWRRGIGDKMPAACNLASLLRHKCLSAADGIAASSRAVRFWPRFGDEVATAARAAASAALFYASALRHLRFMRHRILIQPALIIYARLSPSETPRLARWHLAFIAADTKNLRRVS